MLAVNDGDRIGQRWGQGGTGSGWNDGTAGAYPDWVQIQFPAPKTLNSIVVYTIQDGDASTWIDPTDTLSFSSTSGWGIVDFQVQGWNGTSWDVLGSVTGNNLVKRTFQFANYTTDRIRLWITKASPNKAWDYSRVVEIEAWGN